MFKRIYYGIYYRIDAFKLRLFNFIVPNFFSKYLFKMPAAVYLQKTILTGEGKIEIGNNCVFGYKLGGFHRNGCIELQPRYENAIIKIGNNVATNNNIFICAANRIEIGDDVLIGQNVTFMDFEAHGIHPNKRREIGEIGEIIIGANVWFGNNVIILKDTHIGKNSIVAAGAVVKGKFPDNVVIGGVPGRIIKKLEF